jgi:hypothetical protein
MCCNPFSNIFPSLPNKEVTAVELYRRKEYKDKEG